MSSFIDLTILGVVLGFARFGWKRGLVATALDFVGFGVASYAAVRFHSSLSWIPEKFGLHGRLATFVAGAAIFVPIILLTALAGKLSAGFTWLPGIHLTNRVAGLALGSALGMAIATALLLLGARSPLRSPIEKSTFASKLVSKSNPGLAVITGLTGKALSVVG